MTVQELIDSLEKLENKDMPVRIAVMQYNKVNHVAVTKIDLIRTWHGLQHLMLVSWLPDNMHTVTRKER